MRDPLGGTPNTGLRARAEEASMRRLALTLVWLALGCSGRDPTQPTLSIDAAVVHTPAAQNIAGHVDGQIIGPSAACGGGLTEVGTFTGADGGTFIAWFTGLEPMVLG